MVLVWLFGRGVLPEVGNKIACDTEGRERDS